MPNVQELDCLEVQVLIDNVTDTLSSTPSFVTREWPALIRRGLRRIAGGDICCANHGLSLMIRATAGEREHVVLFDAGPVDYAVEHNGTRLGIDFGAIEAVVLSHGHWDHAGGLLKAFELMRKAAPERRVPIYLHPGMFAERAQRQPDGGVLPFARVPTPEELAAAGARPVVTDQPRVLLDAMFYLSGEIPRVTSYELGLRNQVRRTAAGEWQPDPLIMDERFLAVVVKGKGVVVFTACSHAGVVNVLRHARSCFPDQRLYAVMGGFHLSGETERCIPETVRDIGDFDLGVIAPGTAPAGARSACLYRGTATSEWCRSQSARYSRSEESIALIPPKCRSMPMSWWKGCRVRQPHPRPYCWRRGGAGDGTDIAGGPEFPEEISIYCTSRLCLCPA